MNTDSNSSTGAPASRGYQWLLTFLLSLNFGILFFDRNALNFLMPWVKDDLALSNTQVGLTASALSLTWALSGILFGALSDRTGRRKAFLLGATVAFSLCSFLSGMASDFAMLVGARMLMGAAEGGVMPVSHAMLVRTVDPERRGVAMGIAQNFGSNLLGSFAAPVLLVAFATAFGWRNAFYLAGIPGLVSAALMWWLIREEEREAQTVSGQASPGLRDAYTELLGSRNVVLCALISIALVSYLVVCWAFMPLYLTSVRGFEPSTMGWLMGALGISATFTSFAVPGLSDVIGRKPVMVGMSLLGVILPLGAMHYDGSVWMLATIFFVGWALTGCFPMFMATIPSESIDPKLVATATGFVMGTGEILGGVLLPTVAGKVADATDLDAPLWIMLGLCTLAGLLALGLRETAPRKLARLAPNPA